MTAVPTRHRWLLPLAGFAAVAVFIALVARFWHPVYGLTALIQLDGANDPLKVEAFRELPVYVYRDNGGYDGLYYAQIALDPTLRDPQLPGAIDNFPYRARRILPSVIAWVLGAGRAARITQIYPFLNVAAWLALAVLLWRTLPVEDVHGWIAWAGILFSAGALASVRLALTDLIALVVLAFAIFAAERSRGKSAVGVLAAAALARETSLLAIAGLVDQPWLSWKNFFRGLAVTIPLVGWLAYVRMRAGPADQGWSNFTLPGAGFVEKWRAALAATQTLNDKMLAWTTVLATFGVTTQAAYIGLRPRWENRWWRIGAAYVGLMLFLGTAVWEDFPGAAMRVLLPLTLAFNVLAHRCRAAVAWLLLGNLGIFSGLLAWRDSPFTNEELAAVHHGGIAAIARSGEGWFPIERHAGHRWQWTSTRGEILFEKWPRSQTVALQLDFVLRSLLPRTVILRQDGREIWRAEITEKTSAHHVAIRLPPVTDRIEFVTSAPGVREGAAPDARSLAFALYDLRLSLVEK